MTTDNRQQLYDRIRETSKDEVILEEMIRYGFWPQGSAKPNMPDELIRRRGELQREISDLAQQSRRYANPEQAIKEIMKERMRLAREKRVETKRRQAQQRHDKAKAWADRKRDDIVHAFHVPPQSPVTGIAITGTLVVTLENVILLDQNNQQEEAIFSIRLKDANQNWSDAVVSQPVTISK